MLVLASTALLLTCSGSYANSIAYQGEPSSRAPAGSNVKGFVLSLQPERSQYHLGSPIWVTVEFRNETGKEQVGMDFNSLNSGYDFLISDLKTGQAVPRNKYSTFGAGGHSMSTTWDLAPNNSWFGRFRLDLLYNFKEPGTYSVQVTTGHPVIHNHTVTMRSNKITITVAP